MKPRPPASRSSAGSRQRLSPALPTNPGCRGRRTQIHFFHIPETLHSFFCNTAFLRSSERVGEVFPGRTHFLQKEKSLEKKHRRVGAESYLVWRDVTSTCP